jgi:CheY-like chemotaxis protein
MTLVRRILVVDDEPQIRRVMRSVLLAEGNSWNLCDKP